MPAGPFPKRAEIPNARDTATEMDINADSKQLSSQVLCLGSEPLQHGFFGK